MQFEKSGVNATGLELGMAHHPAQEIDVRDWPQQHGIFQRAAHALDGLVAASPKSNELGDHRIKGRTNFLAFHYAVVNAYSFTGGKTHFQQFSGSWQVAGVSVFSVNPHLKCMTVERDLLPWSKQHNLPLMAYSPLGGDHNLVIANHTLAQVGMTHGCSPAAIALAWVMRSGTVIAIPESGSPAHVTENAAALSIALTPQDLQALDAAFPGPLGVT